MINWQHLLGLRRTTEAEPTETSPRSDLSAFVRDPLPHDKSRPFRTATGGLLILDDQDHRSGAWNKVYLNGRFISPEQAQQGEGNDREYQRSGERVVLRMPYDHETLFRGLHRDAFFLAGFDRFTRLAQEHREALRIPMFYDAGTDEQGGRYQIFERKKGDLQDRIREADKGKDHPFAPERVLTYMQQLIHAHQALYQMGFLNVDLKLQNVLFDDAEDLFLTDLDFLLEVGNTRWEKYFTGVYAAPETPEEHAYDLRSTIYQLGLVFHVLLTRDLSLSKHSREWLDHELTFFRPRQDLVSNHYPFWWPVVQKATAFLPSGRYQTLEAFGDAIQTAYEQRPATYNPLPKT